MFVSPVDQIMANQSSKRRNNLDFGVLLGVASLLSWLAAILLSILAPFFLTSLSPDWVVGLIVFSALASILSMPRS